MRNVLRITWLLVCLGLAPAAMGAVRVALVIGNSAYQNIRPLSNPRNDAQAVASILKGLGFTLLGPTDGVYYDLTEAGFLVARNELERRALGAEIVLVYYAGHGMQGKTGPYLLPVDVPKITQRTDLELVTRRSIDLQETLQLLDGKAGLVVAIFDACREIVEFRAVGLDGTRGMERVRGYGRNRIIAYSAASGQVVPDGSGKHSPYTEKLLASLGQPGLEVADLFRKVSYEVGQQYDQQPEVLIQGVPLGTYYLAQDAPKPVPVPVPVPVPPAPPVVVRTPQPGDVFKDKLQDGSEGPSMVVIPKGSFQMGSPEGEAGRDLDERQHAVTIEHAFALGQHEVTVGEFRRFVEATEYRTEAEKNAGSNKGCYAWSAVDNKWDWRKGFSWRKPGYGQGERHPVVCVSWNDAVAYVGWLSGETQKSYRLPSEAEWEYAARAGTTSARYWGDDANQACVYANVADQTKSPEGVSWKESHHHCADGYWYPAPVGSFKANAWGLGDMLGNVWEWTCSKYTESYDGSEQKCSKNDTIGPFALRGGSWDFDPAWVRSAFRDRVHADDPQQRPGVPSRQIVITLCSLSFYPPRAQRGANFFTKVIHSLCLRYRLITRPEPYKRAMSCWFG